MLTYILFILGFYFLARGAGLLVDGSASLAKRFGVSNIVIGLTIVAFGTSAPEFVVNIISSVRGNSDLVLGNIIGSNISNILLVLGATAMIYPLRVKKVAVWKEMQLSVVAVIAVIVMINDAFFGANHENIITKTDGIILILFFVLFMYFMFSAYRSSGAENIEGTPIYKPAKASLMVFVGLLGLVLGGKWIVDGALLIASNFGVSEGFIGLTLLALGTSLPELATSFVAAYKKNVDLAVGNIIGSNIFNIFGVLGVSAIINPVRLDFSLNSDLMLLLIVTFMILSLVLFRDEHNINRKQGFLFLLIYALYLVFLFYRG
jgi:cation:H+ antiporter